MSDTPTPAQADETAPPTAEALPSQTSGAEALAAIADRLEREATESMAVFGRPDDNTDTMIWAAGELRALAKPASEPAGGGVREKELERHLSWALDNLHMLGDQSDEAEATRAALSSPASSSTAEAEALPAGVDARAVVLEALKQAASGGANGMADHELAEIADGLLASLSSAPAQAASAPAGDIQMLASASVRPEPSEVEMTPAQVEAAERYMRSKTYNDRVIVPPGFNWHELWAAILSASALTGKERPAWTDVIAERRRQIEAEGWTEEHDDGHSRGEMARAAACYADPLSIEREAPPARWPWGREWWKPAGQRRMLVKAGALILAEIERLDRKGTRT